MKKILLGLVAISALCFACVGETTEEKGQEPSTSSPSANEEGVATPTPRGELKVEENTLGVRNGSDKGSSGGAAQN